MVEEDLETQVCMLQSHLDGMIERVQRNEATAKRFQDMEMRLLSLNSLQELTQHILQDVQLAFSLDSLCLVLSDKDADVKQFLSEDGFHFEDYSNLLLLSDVNVFKSKLGLSHRIMLGASADVLADEFWPAGATKPAVVAILPLVRRGVCLGCLVLGSNEEERFQPAMDTYFLERLSKVLSVCMENTVNYEQLRRSSLFDTLTGVNNRRFFEQRLQEEILRSLRTADSLTCLFIDIDFFKKVNDSFGHQVGDLALKHVADSLKSQLRSNDILARYGGEEFVALLPTATEVKGKDVAERMRACIESSPIEILDGKMLKMTVSIGTSTFVVAKAGAHKEVAGEELIKVADKALYKAKNSGRNKVFSGGEVEAEPLSNKAAFGAA
ncbi:MAG: diguanylate cyclase [Piscirickettsiaceae bacterium]|nr:MAG: diguanylate cyclase [Piscirickettsiaceae bacterium]